MNTSAFAMNSSPFPTASARCRIWEGSTRIRRGVTESLSGFQLRFPFVLVLLCIRLISAASKRHERRRLNLSPSVHVALQVKGRPSDGNLLLNGTPHRNRPDDYGRTGKQTERSRHPRLPGRHDRSGGAAALQPLGLLILRANEAGRAIRMPGRPTRLFLRHIRREHGSLRCYARSRSWCSSQASRPTAVHGIRNTMEKGEWIRVGADNLDATR